MVIYLKGFINRGELMFWKGRSFKCVQSEVDAASPLIQILSSQDF